MLNELYSALQELTDIPCAYGFFREVPEPPYIIFQVTYSNNFDADDRVYVKRDRYNVILYTSKKEPETEEAVEDALDDGGFIYDKTETFMDSEELFQIVYTIFGEVNTWQKFSSV